MGKSVNFNCARYGEENIKKYGEYISLIYQEENLAEDFTNVQIQRRANALAHGLKDYGVKPREVVAVILPNGPAVIVAFTAIFKMGAVFLPIIFALTTHEIHFILEDSRAHTVITDGNLLPKVEEAAKGLNNIKKVIVKSEGPPPPLTISFDEMVKGYPDHFDITRVAPDDLAVLMYTAGTTGFPKGVMLSHHNIGPNVEAGLVAWPIGPEDTVLIPIPLNHIFGLLMVNECNLTGANIVLHKWFEPGLVLKSIGRHQVSQFVGVPTMYVKLIEAYNPDIHRLDSIRRWICGGAPLSVETLRFVEAKLGGRLFQGYGLTEASPTVARQREGRPRKPASVGPAIPGVEIKILDDADREVPLGQVGEICVRGPNVMKGYLNREEETRWTLRSGWLHTGDLGCLDSDGELFITDRKKDLIIRGGENISPGALEEILYRHPAVREAAVVGIPDRIYGEEIKAYVVLKAGDRVSEQELIDHCLKFTARFQAPKSIAFLAELPKSSVGKILKRKLRDLKE